MQQKGNWIQNDYGLWTPMSCQPGKNTQNGQGSYQTSHSHEIDPESNTPQSWRAYWETKGQPWRSEPEIDQERQQFLAQRLTIEVDYLQDIFPFKDILLMRADIEWLIEKQEEEQDGTQRKKYNFQQAILQGSDLSFLPLNGASFARAQLEGAKFWHTQLEGANFNRAQLKEALFRSAQLEKANFRRAQLKRANFVQAWLEEANFDGAWLEEANFARAKLGGTNFDGVVFANNRGVGPYFSTPCRKLCKGIPSH